MKNGTFGEKQWKNGRKNGRKTALFFTKIRSPVSGVEKWGKIEVSGGLRKIGDFIGLQEGYTYALQAPQGCSPPVLQQKSYYHELSPLCIRVFVA